MKKSENKTSSKLPKKGAEEAALHGIWSGTISFSLVAIPIQLVKAVESGRVSFRMLHKKDYSPLVRRMFCTEDGVAVPADEIVRGYEIAPDKYIIITDEELESVSAERSRTIEIMEFIDMSEVDPIYFDHPYYLVPLKGGEKAYRLLVEVMHRTNKAGLAKFVLSEREYLIAIKSTGEALALITLHYHGDILPDEEIVPKVLKTDAGERNRIAKEIKRLKVRYSPEKYADLRRQKIVELLGRKLKTRAAVEAPAVEETEGEGPADLVAALQEIMHGMKPGMKKER